MRRALGIAALVLVALLAAGPAVAGQLSVIEENDSLFFTSDKHYTQGLRVAYLSDPLRAGWRYDAFDFAGPLFPGAGPFARRFDWIPIGQSIFTPLNITRNPPDPRDRPYAGWLYTGAALLQENGGNQLTGIEALVGVVGSDALAAQVQNDWHQFVAGISGGQGWHGQLKNEPAVALSYEKRWRLTLAELGGVGVDAVPELGATVGNVLTYGAVGGMVRLGQDLGADYGPARIRPGPSGTDWFDSSRLDHPFGWYIFVGAEGRAVARNIFLDGNTFASSPHVDKEPLVGDLTGGVALFWKDAVRLDIGLLTRTREFRGQQGEDSFAGFRFAFGL